MPTWSSSVTGQSAEMGRWNASGGWNGTAFNGLEVTQGSEFGGMRWTGVAVPSGVTILSATITITSSYSTGVPFVSLFNVDSMPALASGQPSSLPRTSEAQVVVAGGVMTVDVTSQFTAVHGRSGWSSGGAVGTYWRAATSAGNFQTRRSSVSLTLAVEWQDPIQYLNVAGRVVGLASAVVPLDVERAVSVAGTVVAVASVLSPDVVAPVSLFTNPVVGSAAVHPPAMSGSGDAPPLNVADTVVATAVVPVPSLTRTIPPEPPPIPWERLVVDPMYGETLTSRTRRTNVYAEVISEDDVVLAQLGQGATAQDSRSLYPGIIQGSVKAAGRSAITWTCDLTINNLDLLPTHPTDLLHPLSHNSLRLWWRIMLPDGRVGRVPLGTYYPDLTPHADDGATVTVRFMGSDAVAEIKRALWNTSLELGGMTIDQAIITILQDRAPWVKHAITPTTVKVPEKYEPGEPGKDPWLDVEALAQVAGMRVYADRMGVIRSTPREASPLPRASFHEGDGSLLLGLPRIETNLDGLLVNHVTVVSSSPDVDPPVMGVAVDDDPSSPLSITRGHLYVKRIENPIVTTAKDAKVVAENILRDRSATQTVDAEVVPHPHLDPWDIVNVQRNRAFVSGDYVVEGWQMDLDVGGRHTLVLADMIKEGGERSD